MVEMGKQVKSFFFLYYHLSYLNVSDEELAYLDCTSDNILHKQFYIHLVHKYFQLRENDKNL